MSNTINISLQEVNDLAANLRQIGNQMHENLMESKNEMNKLDGIWEAESSNTIRERFNLFSQKFDDMKNVIDSYASFLERISNSYDSLETTINLNATNFN
ncbi:MAG: pore-forming ESAT-6 family protein [Erysipelotrichaceae bacterium]|nr:pore-forming ESAT-6 family protein [Erysipelotrichaceae bacterium]